LDPAEEMEPRAGVRDRVGFGEKLLRVILTDVFAPGLRRGSDGVGPETLGDGDDPNFVRATSSRRDAGPDSS